jgi:hypothetical protein
MTFSIGPGFSIGAGFSISSGGPTPGVDGTFGYAEMPTFNPGTIEDGTATLNAPTGFTINSPEFTMTTGTGVAVTNPTISNYTFLNNLPGPGFYNFTWGAGSTATNTTAFIQGNSPFIFYESAGLTYPFTFNFPFTVSATPLPSFTISAGDYATYYNNTTGAGGTMDTSGFSFPTVQDVGVNYVTLTGLNSGLVTQLNTIFSGAGLATNGFQGYVFQVSWPSGSGVPAGLARVAWQSSSQELLIAPIDPNDPGQAWRTNDTSNNDPTGVPSLSGNFSFIGGAIFTPWTPTIELSSYWC